MRLVQSDDVDGSSAKSGADTHTYVTSQLTRQLRFFIESFVA